MILENQSSFNLKSSTKNKYHSYYLLCLLLITLSCNSQKETIANQGIQNLTARYNILFNANEILKESEQNISAAYQEDYEQIIHVYIEPNEIISQSEIAKLDEVITKSNTIINEKGQSKYVDDAYFLIAKANYYKSNFFNAAEFLTYLINSNPNNKKLKLSAFTWKARALIALERYSDAKENLDSASKYILNNKKAIVDFHAVYAQLLIIRKNYEEAAREISTAKKLTKRKQEAVKWTYLLAQLQKQNGQFNDAYKNYTAVVRSNAPFEMAFNANLNRLGIIDSENKDIELRIARLKTLLKDDKNASLIDQIYYQIGKVYQKQGNIESAIENYKLSIKNNSKNTNQKGLSYLALAEIYIEKQDYVKAKSSYDDALRTLPPSYPNYDLINKKAKNLEILSDALSIIAREDTLQMLAKLPEDERKLRVKLAEDSYLQKPTLQNQTGATSFNNGITKSSQLAQNNSLNGKYYFDNTIAISQGFSDFKNKWGNRKLEDNWRRGQKSATEITTNEPVNSEEIVSGIPNDPDVQHSNPTGRSKSLIDDIPLTPETLIASNAKIATALYDIGNYYHEILNDDQEAVKYFELLLVRFPDNSNKLAVYYNLYRLNELKNPQKSLEYKNILLNQFPNSPFAKVIVDPHFNEKTGELENALNQIYNDAYNKYIDKAYQEVLVITDKALKEYADNKLSPQLAYLNSLAYGHLHKIAEFENSLKKIASDFPDDKLIVPLVMQNLSYITENRESLSKRPFALLENDYDANFIEEPAIVTANEVIISKNADNTTSAIIPKSDDAGNKIDKPSINDSSLVKATEVPEEIKKSTTDTVVTENNESPKTSKDVSNAITEPDIFSNLNSSEYYFVINVLDPGINLNSSRFGIGQFNRANFAGDNIKHQLKEINGENQLIVIGAFENKEKVENYGKNITGMLKEIMKVSFEKYNYFIISKQNLDLLKDRIIIEKYKKFEQNNF
ncbi:MAG: tetratricopeptide repeat protein [Sphingobacteriales bacterium]|nr:tetratricopeptide repeat protein [Sphingobacteriales bacterium]